MRDTIDMAREVKATAYTNRHYPDRTTYTFGPEQLKAFVELVRTDEREACAKICDDQQVGLASYFETDERIKECADAIRARGETK